MTALGHIASEEPCITKVPLGDSLINSGVARLDALQIKCDGREISGQVWAAGAALARHLLDSSSAGGLLMADRPTVVEVGAGTGIAGLAAALAGASVVTLTDLPDHLYNIDNAIASNHDALERRGATVVSCPLAWGDAAAAAAASPDGCDFVIAADCIYNPALLAALAATLAELARPTEARILVAYEERWSEWGLWGERLEQAWHTASAAAGLERVGDELELGTPASMPRRVLLAEYRVREEYLFGPPDSFEEAEERSDS